MSTIRENKATLFGAVSMTTIKATPVWKEEADSFGRLPQEKFNSTIKKALAYLGWDNNIGGYDKDNDLVNIRSSSSKQTVYRTSVYRFPVRATFKYKKVYEKLDILHCGEELFEGWGNSHIRLKDFGNELQPPTDGFSDLEDSVGEV